jgi:hypothetical protein
MKKKLTLNRKEKIWMARKQLTVSSMVFPPKGRDYFLETNRKDRSFWRR